jgi:hypothetical protein
MQIKEKKINIKEKNEERIRNEYLLRRLYSDLEAMLNSAT